MRDNRLIIRNIAAGLLILTAGLWLLRVPPFEGEPSFYRNADSGERRYACGEEPDAEIMTVRFSDDGRDATVNFRSRDLPLRFSHTTWMEDVYKNNSWSLYLDPEANLYGPNGFRTWACF